MVAMCACQVAGPERAGKRALGRGRRRRGTSRSAFIGDRLAGAPEVGRVVCGVESAISALGAGQGEPAGTGPALEPRTEQRKGTSHAGAAVNPIPCFLAPGRQPASACFSVRHLARCTCNRTLALAQPSSPVQRTQPS